MTTESVALMTSAQQAAIVEQVVLQGDLAKLSPQQRVNYYQAVCQSVGVNPLTKPFDYITLNGKLTLYATRTCTDQIRANTKLSISIISREVLEDIYVVTARGTMPDGRTDESTGAVNIAGLKGEAKANAYMKCETKAKRRLTLSMAGLGWLDESEVGSVADARTVRVDPDTGEILEAPKVVAPATPQAQHPLVAIGFTSRLVFDMAQWIGKKKPAAKWSAEQKSAAKALTQALIETENVGVPVEELTEILTAYFGLPGDPLTNVAACLAQLETLRQSPPTLEESDAETVPFPEEP